MSMGGGGGGGQPQPTSTTNVTKVEPFAEQKPYLTQTFAEAQKQYEAGGPQFFPGSTIAPQDPLQIAASNALLNYANTTASNLASNTTNANNFLLGPVLYPQSNPALAAYGQASVRPIYDALTDRVLPSIRGNAVVNGQFGGSRQGIAEGLAARAADQSASDTLAKIYSDAYGQGLDALTKGMLFAPQTLQIGAAPIGYTEAVGEQQRSEAQAKLDEQIARYNYEQTLPAAMLAQFSNLVQGNYGGTTTAQGTALTQAGARTSPLLGLAGGALAGASIGSSIPGIGTGWGAAGGALLGLLLGGW